MELAEEVEEGPYTITVKDSGHHKKEFSTSFKVEEYVLPRYEVVINPPKFILATDQQVTFELCARYTFGQPLGGNASILIEAGNSYMTYFSDSRTSKISGCEKFVFDAAVFRFDENNCHIRISELRVSAAVTEDGTGVTLSALNVTAEVQRSLLRFTEIPSLDTSKPYLPVEAKIRVSFPDDQPAKGEKFSLCFGAHYEDCIMTSTDDRGILTFAVTTDSVKEQGVKITSLKYPSVHRNWNEVISENSYYKRFAKKVLPSLSSLTIYLADTIQCTSGEDINITIPVVYVMNQTSEGDVYAQILSRGQVQAYRHFKVKFVELPLPYEGESVIGQPESTEAVNITRGFFNVNFTLPATVSPDIKVMVWTVGHEGEIIADSSTVKVSDCLPNEVTMLWSNSTLGPGSNVQLSLVTKPHSLCSYDAVDKSVDLLRKSEAPHRPIIRELMSFASQAQPQEWDQSQLQIKYCKMKLNFTYQELSENSTSTSSKSSARFYDYYFQYNKFTALHAFDAAGLLVISDRRVDGDFCDQMLDSYLKDKLSAGNDELELGGSPDLSFVSSFEKEDEESDALPDQSQENEKTRTYFPETWLWDLVNIPAPGALLLSLTLPDEITEWTGRAVCLNMESGFAFSKPAAVTTFKPFFVDLTLPPSVKRGEIFPVLVSVFNYWTKDSEISVVLKGSEDFEFVDLEDNGRRSSSVLANGKVVHSIKIRPKVIGDLNLTISAVSSAGTGDRLTKPITVEAEGVERGASNAVHMCGRDGETEVTDVIKGSLPLDIVEDSARNWLTVSGDILGPSAENLGNLVAFPYGCGEQNMARLAANVYVTKYLLTTNQGTEELKKRALEYIKKGYQRQLLFRHGDGSFSSFGKNDQFGSMWLTAFVVKTLSEAQGLLHVDKRFLEEGKDWMKTHQQDSGCFTSIGKVVNRLLRGGNGKNNFLLTGYVVAALIAAGEDPASTNVTRALECLDMDVSAGHYGQALKAYAHALAGSTKAESLLKNLLQEAVASEFMLYWQDESKAVLVETAGYALLALLANNPVDYEKDCRKIVAKLTTERNTQGGFVSTQDTVVVINALTEFEKKYPTKIHKLTVKVVVDNAAVPEIFFLGESNKLLQQRLNLPESFDSVAVNVSGQGCAVVQVNQRYNVKEAKPSQAFAVRVTNQPESSSCHKQEVTICTVYLLSDKASNMAIVEVKMVSGYIPLKEDLNLLKELKSFKRHEVDGNKLHLYWDEITDEEICFRLGLKQEIVVENAKPGAVRVYDYYQPELSTTSFYELPVTEDCS